MSCLAEAFEIKPESSPAQVGSFSGASGCAVAGLPLAVAKLGAASSSQAIGHADSRAELGTHE